MCCSAKEVYKFHGGMPTEQYILVYSPEPDGPVATRIKHKPDWLCNSPARAHLTKFPDPAVPEPLTSLNFKATVIRTANIDIEN